MVLNMSTTEVSFTEALQHLLIIGRKHHETLSVHKSSEQH